MTKQSFTIINLGLLALGLMWFGRFTFAKYFYMREFFQASPVKIIKANKKELLEDRMILSHYDLFYPSSGTKDAGPYLNPLVRWEIGEIAHRGSLTLPEFIHKELSQDWVLKKPLFKKMGITFDWMKNLHKYDIWSLEVGSPAYPDGKIISTYSFPLPTFRDLLGWAKLRYLYGKETDNISDALKDVRQLTRLIFTNDTIVSSMMALELLKIENQFEEILIPREIGDWKFIPIDHIMRAKRHFYSLPATVDIRLPDEIFEKMVKTNVGLCPMLFESMMHYLSMRDLLGEELKYGFSRMHEAIIRSGCRRTYFHKLWSDPEWNAFPLEGKEYQFMGKSFGWSYIREHPALKAAIGFKEATLAQPRYFFQYSQETR